MKKQILTESGIKNIGELRKQYDNAKIYFHQDLDGVTTALAMKSYLESCIIGMQLMIIERFVPKDGTYLQQMNGKY